MPTSRNHLFSAAAVFAIAMIVGAWTTSTRGGEEDHHLEIDMVLPPISTFLEGGLCYGTVAYWNEHGNVSFQWSSTYHMNGSTRNIEDYMGYQDGWQNVQAWDDGGGDDTDSEWIDVDEFGDECEP